MTAPDCLTGSLADPTWNKPGSIDVLLGADLFSRKTTRTIPGNKNSPDAMESIFGFFASTVATGLSDTLKAFWEVEEVCSKPSISPENQVMESWFSSHYSCTPDGCFTISLPFKDTDDLPVSCGSRSIADRRLLTLERRLAQKPATRQLHIDFMKNYWYQNI